MNILSLYKKMELKIFEDEKCYEVIITEGVVTLEVEIIKEYPKLTISGFKYLKLDDDVETKGKYEDIKYVFDYLSSSKVVTDEFTLLNKIKI